MSKTTAFIVTIAMVLSAWILHTALVQQKSSYSPSRHGYSTHHYHKPYQPLTRKHHKIYQG